MTDDADAILEWIDDEIQKLRMMLAGSPKDLFVDLPSVRTLVALRDEVEWHCDEIKWAKHVLKQEGQQEHAGRLRAIRERLGVGE